MTSPNRISIVGAPVGKASAITRSTAAQSEGKQSARLSHPVFSLLSVAVAFLWVVPGTRAETNDFPEFKLETARSYLRQLGERSARQLATNSDSLYLQARLQNELGDKQEAERLAHRALDLEGNRPEIQVFLAEILIRQDRMEEAETCLRKALQANPKVPAGQGKLGMVLDRLGKRAEAEAAFRAAVADFPNDGTSRLLLGRFLLDQGQVEAAARELETACELDPESANPWYPLFQARTRLGDREGAAKALKKFKELKKVENAGMGVLVEDNPQEEPELRKRSAAFHVEVASLLLREGKPKLAEPHLKQALQLRPSDLPACELLTRCYVQGGRLSEARKLLEDLVRAQPKMAAAHASLGTLQLQQREYAAAVAQLKQALELDPNQKQALHNLAMHYLNTRTELKEALVLAQRLVTTEASAPAYDLLGRAYYAAGSPKEALKALGRAIQMDPQNQDYRQKYERLEKVAGAGSR